MLYSLLLSERTAAPVPSGLLYYTQNDEVIEVSTARNEVRALVGVRNTLADWTSKRGRKWDAAKKTQARMEVRMDEDDLILEKSGAEPEPDDGPYLPPPIDEERACTHCYALDTCMLIRRVRFSLIPDELLSQIRTDGGTSSSAGVIGTW
jgi:DNA replication ATP-dependent helicase Dna2